MFPFLPKAPPEPPRMSNELIEIERDIYKHEQRTSFFRSVYIAAIRAGSTSTDAYEKAITAAADLNRAQRVISEAIKDKD